MTEKTQSIAELQGLGPKSVKCLNQVGIYAREDLEKTGAVKAFIKLQHECTHMKPSLNLLYAMVGALENTHRKIIAKNEKARLLMELADYQEIEATLNDDP